MNPAQDRIHGPAKHLGEPEINGRENSEQRAADHHEMKMADHAEAKTDLNKRRFLVNGAIGTATFLGLSNHNPLFANGASSHSGETVHKEPKTSPVSPPGSKSIDHLNKIVW